MESCIKEARKARSQSLQQQCSIAVQPSQRGGESFISFGAVFKNSLIWPRHRHHCSCIRPVRYFEAAAAAVAALCQAGLRLAL